MLRRWPNSDHTVSPHPVWISFLSLNEFEQLGVEGQTASLEEFFSGLFPLCLGRETGRSAQVGVRSENYAADTLFKRNCSVHPDSKISVCISANTKA